MAYPKWLQRSAHPGIDNRAFATHASAFYMAQSDIVWRVDSWCEHPDTSQLILSTTEVLDLPGSPGTIYNLFSAQGLLWISAGSNLYSYNTGTEVLGGPWALSGCGLIEDIEEYGGEIHVIARCGPGNTPQIWKFTGASMVLALNTWPSNASYTPYPYLHLEEFQGDLYYGTNWRLERWDGVAKHVVFDWWGLGRPYVGPLVNVSDSVLYIGTGRSTQTLKLWKLEGGAVSFICEISPNTSSPLEMAYKADENSLYVVSAYRSEIYRVDLTAGTPSIDGSGSTYSWTIDCWVSDNSVWAGHRQTKVYDERLCVEVALRAETRYILA